MSKNILDQIKHCCDQLERFSLMFLNKTTDSAERIVQFGYNLGRLMVLTRILNKFVYELNSDLKNYSMSMAQMILNKGLTDTPIDQELIDYGFAIGSLKMYAFAYILTRLFSMSLRKFLLSMKVKTYENKCVC